MRIGISGWRRIRNLVSGGYPHPYSGEKFPVFISLREVRCRKVLSGKDLSAESSQERTYSG